ncbi:RNA-directed DNA polymerase from mobile element jockey [Trichonephila clavipes]|nr:RNA-directed DNA polymerase from mobile element jockey [Trichonephila clavipes]
MGKIVGGKLKVFPEDANAHRKIQNFISVKKLKSHTYEMAGEKQLKTVIRGLPSDFDVDEIIQELGTHNITPEHVSVMRNRKQNKNMPLFLVVSRKCPANQAIFQVTSIGIELGNNTHLTLSCIYKPPRNHINTSELDAILNASPKVMLFGDFNAHHPCWNPGRPNTHGNTLYNWASTHALEIMAPTAPTYYAARGTCSILDIAFAKNLILEDINSVNDLSSDHNPVLIDLALNNSLPKNLRTLKSTNWIKFQEIVFNSIPGNPIIDTNNIDNAINNFTGMITSAISATTVTKVISTPHLRLPHRIRELIKIKNRFPDYYPPLAGRNGILYSDDEKAEEFKNNLEATFQENAEPYNDQIIELVESETSDFLANSNDAAVLAQGANLKYTQCTLQRYLHTLESWLTDWRIAINVDKTQAIVFRKHRRNIIPKTLSLFDEDIEWVNVVRYLGLFLDSSLTYRQHTKYICDKFWTKIHLSISLIGRRSPLSLKNKVLLYKQVLRPVLTSCFRPLSSVSFVVLTVSPSFVFGSAHVASWLALPPLVAPPLPSFGLLSHVGLRPSLPFILSRSARSLSLAIDLIFIRLREVQPLLKKFIRNCGFLLSYSSQPSTVPTRANARPATIDFGISCGLDDILVETHSELSSDHNPVQFIIPTTNNNRLYAQNCTTFTNWNLFQEILHSTIPGNPNISNANEIDEKIAQFTYNIHSAINQSSKVKVIKHNITFIPRSLRTKIAEKNRLRKQWQATRFPHQTRNANSYPDDIHKIIRKKKTSQIHYPPLLGYRGLVYDTLDKANLFAETLEETFTENPEPYDDDHIEDVERQVRRFFRTTSFQPLLSPHLERCAKYLGPRKRKISRG